jgi:hypothetical protein
LCHNTVRVVCLCNVLSFKGAVIRSFFATVLYRTQQTEHVEGPRDLQ